ncbi:molecular chaperone Hsp20 [Spirochaetia bacterium]|nr:molecular chaperone Hsp20 [Spirochaetia bacterium]
MKAVTLYRPMTSPRAIENALNDFDRYMESFFGESPLTPAASFGREPAVDIKETAETYELTAELPGHDEKNIEVHVDGGVLTIETGNQGSLEDEKTTEERYVIRERRSSSFSRSFKLPENADMEAITASFKNGLLCLEIKKRAEAKKRVIRIEGK